MITDEKLTVYQRYDGDIDGWVRAGTPLEKSLMTDDDWTAIAELLLRLALVKSGRAADTFESETQRMIAATVKDKGVAQRMMDWA